MAQHPGNNYYVQPSTGTIQRQSNPVAIAALKLAGFQGPMTWDQAQGVIALNKKVAQSGKAPITTTTQNTGTAVKNTAQDITNPASWFSGIGGLLGSGLESGFIAIINDIWTFIFPYIQIGAGIILALFVIGFIFKDDLLGMVPGIAAAAAL